MNAIVLPDIDRSTLEDLKERMPSLKLSEIELPSMERAGRDVGRNADRALDRMLGRSHASAWSWLAAAIGIAAVVGVVAGLLTWARRSAWSGTMRPDWSPRRGTTYRSGSGYEPGATDPYASEAIVRETIITSVDEPADDTGGTIGPAGNLP